MKCSRTALTSGEVRAPEGGRLVVRFMIACEAEGIELLHCGPYIQGVDEQGAALSGGRGGYRKNRDRARSAVAHCEFRCEFLTTLG